ncbi:MAG: hypothetical protein ABJO88_03665 [Parasphingorhabdus sp.]
MTALGAKGEETILSVSVVKAVVTRLGSNEHFSPDLILSKTNRAINAITPLNL